MPGGLKIHLFALTWNEGRMLPYFFRHYDELVDAYYFLDAGSTDGTRELLQAHPNAHVEQVEDQGESLVDQQRRLYDAIWMRSRGVADWVVVTEIDEFVYRPQLVAYLMSCRNAGVTAIRAIGYEMVAPAFPTTPGRLTDIVTRGCRSIGHNRLCIFDPNALSATRFGPGRHAAWPEGHVVFPPSSEVLLLHFMQFGVDYVAERSAELATRLRPADRENGWGVQLDWSRDEIRKAWVALNAKAAAVPGLGEWRGVEPAQYRGKERIVEASGLLDVDWYLATYPDLVNYTDPENALTHYCHDGWKERRMPNFYFDPAWYLEQRPELARAGVDPLLHYIQRGEREGQRPSPRFDPVWYRTTYALPEGASPLRHYLQNFHSGKFSPVPDFDVEAYCGLQPEVLEEHRDPYEDFHNRRHLFVGSKPEPMPTFAQVLQALGFEAGAGVYPASLSFAAFCNVLKMFCRHDEVDEAWYRSAYADVDGAIRKGMFHNARDHYVSHGYFEGRLPRRPAEPDVPPAAPVTDA